MAAPTSTEKFVNWITGVPMALYDAVGSIFNPSGANASIGLVPKPPDTPGATLFLCEDGTWKASGAAILATVSQARFIGRAAGAGSGPATELTGTQAAVIVDAFVGDSGGGGLKGQVPAPASADAANGKFLFADGSFKGGLVKLNGGVITSSQTNLDIVLTSFPNYKGFIFKVQLLPVTDGVDLHLQFSTDGGGTFIATNYGYGVFIISDDGVTVAGYANTNTTQLLLTTSTVGARVGNAATEGVSASVELINPFSTTLWARMQYQGSYISNAATPIGYQVNGMGSQKTANNVDAVRFKFSSGDIASGQWDLLGWA